MPSYRIRLEIRIYRIGAQLDDGEKEWPKTRITLQCVAWLEINDTITKIMRGTKLNEE